MSYRDYDSNYRKWSPDDKRSRYERKVDELKSEGYEVDKYGYVHSKDRRKDDYEEVWVDAYGDVHRMI